MRSGGEIVIVPDRGIFNVFKPVGGMERVRFENDPEFERRFEVYAFEPQQAMMLVGTTLRRALLELRQAGRVFGYIGPDEVLVAGWGRDRFEPGSMFRAIPGEERVRAMLEDVCAGLATLERLRAAMPRPEPLIAAACSRITAWVLASLSNTPYQPCGSCGGSPSQAVSPGWKRWSACAARPSPLHAQKLDPPRGPPPRALSSTME